MPDQVMPKLSDTLRARARMATQEQWNALFKKHEIRWLARIWRASGQGKNGVKLIRSWKHSDAVLGKMCEYFRDEYGVTVLPMPSLWGPHTGVWAYWTEQK